MTTHEHEHAKRHSQSRNALYREDYIEMADEDLLKCIAVDPRVMAGKPVVRGTRLTVEFVLNLLAHGQTVDEILHEYDHLPADDIRACVIFAARLTGPPDGPDGAACVVGT